MVELSVVIAVYNKQDYIGNTLESVLNQTYPNFEVVIVNDGSKDKSEEVILSFNDPRIKYYSQENAGAGAARPAGPGGALGGVTAGGAAGPGEPVPR